jgi:hypothetical protein
VELGSAVTVSDPFGPSVSEELTMSSVSRSRSSNRTCGSPASRLSDKGANAVAHSNPEVTFA